jgi:hypothetical protein
MFEIAASVVLGGILTILVAMFVEQLRRPKLSLSIGTPPIDVQYPEDRPAREMRSVNVWLSNKPLPWFARWMTRAPALQCRGTITFHHLDGQNVFGRVMEARWSNSVQPAPLEGTGIVSRKQPNSSVIADDLKIHIIDPMRLSLKSRIDVYPGEKEELNVAVRLDDDQACYGWNNETYFSTPPWRNEKWKLGPERYLIEVIVSSSGSRCVGVFCLINDVARTDFRLEAATRDQVRLIKANRSVIPTSG